ncbi:hypothetical protein FJ364_04890 [Candidatus Dependentiae bacterium]|nr:hypothetical protein [Candidatus Dependentiae bacterium]
MHLIAISRFIFLFLLSNHSSICLSNQQFFQNQTSNSYLNIDTNNSSKEIIRQEGWVSKTAYIKENNLKTLLSPCHCNQPLEQCATDISFGIADIKFDTNSLKILELGEGTRSKYAGFDNIYGYGAMWQRIWQFLFSKNNNVFFVDYDLETPDKRKEIDYKTLIQYGGKAFTSLQQLINYHALHQLMKQPDKHPLVVIRHEPACNQTLTQFNKDYPQLIICNAKTALFVNNKQKTNELFTTELQDYRPYAKLVAKKEAPSLAEQILQESDAKAFVIKPLTACKGKGVMFTPRAKLTETLTHLFGPQQRLRYTPSHEFKYWATDHSYNTHALIESCEHSKPVIIDNKKYDATLRVVFGLMHANGNLQATLLGSYWKLPVKSLEENGSLHEKKLSRISSSHQSSVAVIEEDETVIADKLLPVLTNLYAKMITAQGNEQ